MSLQGDLSTIDLAGLLQNLEAAEKSGLLEVTGSRGPTKIYFDNGRLTLITFPRRELFVDLLVTAGLITPNELEVAKKRRKKSKRSIGATLVAMGVIDKEQLAHFAGSRLMDEGCELVASGGGAFTFTEGPVPRGVFDPEERALAIGIPAGPLLLESARRQDHWSQIRERVPSDGTHYVLQHPPRTAPEGAAAQLQAELVELLDGSRSVRELVAHFPHQRFEAYQLLSDMVDAQVVRPAGPADMNRLAQQLAEDDRERAWEILERGLKAHPQNPSLLSTKALLAQDTGELEAASEALKTLVHMQLHSEDPSKALEGLEKLKGLEPDDPFVWERSFEFALKEDRREDALKDGRRLAELYRGPGLFRKAAAVLEKLVELEPGSWELLRDLAHNRADAGDREAAVAGLEPLGQEHLARDDYGPARKVYEEILVLDPDHTSAREILDKIESGDIARRKAFFKRLRRRLTVGLIALTFLGWFGYEGLARREYLEISREITRKGLIEGGRYRDALEKLLEFQKKYPWSTTALYEVPVQMQELQAKLPDDYLRDHEE